MMIQRILLFRNLVENIPKNIGLYSVGILLLVLYRITLETTSMLLGMLAFIISYSSVYVLNDIWDIAEDALDAEKIPRKPLARGYVDRREAVKLFATLLVIGLVLSTCLNILFFGLVCSLIFVNALYSAPLLRNRRIGYSIDETAQKHNSDGVEYHTSLKYTVLGLPLILIMQFLKILLPWTIKATRKIKQSENASSKRQSLPC
ncbi:MAG: UbiA family prenyltransferase [Candidatus Thorarchaeota archaeon]|jgi:1,4-dihydroxy-2-naphthoate octaprenyltransferase